jgi:hypothetical protein
MPHSLRNAPQTATLRYAFHSDPSLTCTLVRRNGQWHVEQESGGSRVRFTLSEFEQTKTGKQLGLQLELAVREALEY